METLEEIMDIKFTGLVTKGERLQFSYRVTIGGTSTEYFTGIGWIKKKREEGTKIFHVPREYANEFAKVFKPFGPLVLQELPKEVYRVEPKPSDVAECLLGDIEAGSVSFNDFCDNYGYSNDSIKAFDTYRACMDAARKFPRQALIKYLTDEQKYDLGIEE